LTTLSAEFKKKIADMYSKNRDKLEALEPKSMQFFSSRILELITQEKKKSDAIHDLEILEYNMGLLKNYSSSLNHYEPETDDYDFTRIDCKKLVDSTKKWLTLEKLI
jgi:hypothetical protein